MKKMQWIVLALIYAAIVGGPARASNLFANPGFEADDASSGPVSPPTGWLASGDVGVDTTFTNSGNNDAFLGSGTLSQSVATTAGLVYELSAFIAVNDFGTYTDAGATFNVTLNGIDVFGTITPATVGLATYTLFDADVIASSSSSLLAFTGLTTGDSGTWYLDDVSLSATAQPVPEPASLLFLGSSWLAWAVGTKLRRSTQARGNHLGRYSCANG